MDSYTLKRLNELKGRRNAAILAHNYQRPEVQDAADFVGGSLELAMRASETGAGVIVLCAVHFMAETAALMCPRKTILLPDSSTRCRMGRLLTAAKVRNMRADHPQAVVVTHINTSAAVKAESDICCTSFNAPDVVRSIPREKEVIFIPDKYLGDYVARQLDRPLILPRSYCPIHQRLLPEHIDAARAALGRSCTFDPSKLNVDLEDKEAEKKKTGQCPVIVQPDSSRDVIAKADAVCTHRQLFDYCRESDAEEFIIGTENGMLYRLSQEISGKKFHPALPVPDCPTMQLPTLDKILLSLEDMQYRVTVAPDVADKARKALQRMLDIAPCETKPKEV